LLGDTAPKFPTIPNSHYFLAPLFNTTFTNHYFLVSLYMYYTEAENR